MASPIFDSPDQVVGAVYGCRNRFNPHVGIGIGPLKDAGDATARLGGRRRTGPRRPAGGRPVARPVRAILLGRPRPRTTTQPATPGRTGTRNHRPFQRYPRLLRPVDEAGADRHCNLVAAVMDRLTEAGPRVRRRGRRLHGRRPDGDVERPATRPTTPSRRARRALAMLGDLPKMNEEWKDRLGCPLRLGIGLNTGRALCGNTGSRQKFKYGPLGHAVNLASRVEGATKHFAVPLLITGTTREQLGTVFRRGGSAKSALSASTSRSTCTSCTPKRPRPNGSAPRMMKGAGRIQGRPLGQHLPGTLSAHGRKPLRRPRRAKPDHRGSHRRSVEDAAGAFRRCDRSDEQVTVDPFQFFIIS